MLTRWDPFSELSRLQDQMMQWTGRGQPSGMFVPAVNIYEDENVINLRAELPGVRPDDVQVSVENNVLTISGERRVELEAKEEGYRRLEHSYGTFTRSFVLPVSVDDSRIDAELKDGILAVTLPKRPEAQRRKIEVRAKADEAHQIEAQAKERPRPKGQA